MTSRIIVDGGLAIEHEIYNGFFDRPIFDGCDVRLCWRRVREHEMILGEFIIYANRFPSRSGQLGNIEGGKIIVEGLSASRPGNPVTLIYRSSSLWPDIKLTNLQHATLNQILEMAHYLYDVKLEESPSPKSYDLFWNKISKLISIGINQRAAKAQVKPGFISQYGEEFSRPFDQAMYRRRSGQVEM